MVTLRGRGTGDAEQSAAPQQRRHRAARRSLEAPPTAPPEGRSRSASAPEPRMSAPEPRMSAPETRMSAVDDRSHVDSSDEGKRASAAARRPRRSSRRTKQTSRYQAAGTSAATPDGGVKTRRWLSDNKDAKVDPEAQSSRTPETSDADGGVDSDGQEAAADEDTNQNLDAKLSRASALYKGPSSDSLRGTFRIGASGPNRNSFRPMKRPHPSDDDSDSEAPAETHSWRRLSRSDRLARTRRDKMGAGAGLADIDPMAIDQSVGFDSIGGLSGHIAALKEMVVFPLLYPEVFENFKIQPPRGCLFYGPPGTGKTLVARALASECSSSSRKVSFFMRKGADCLSKWVGESERQLRLLFQQAYQMRPSIIFFDEIDGLAPVRSSRQDQIHSSIVSTLLALMDGLDGRGEVVVIGATNRLDSIDPALRRPGRFDREFLFGLPDREARKEILRIHTRPWNPAPCDHFLDQLAEKCVGYCGADLRAVCTEAALCALRRRYPQIYGSAHKLLLDVASIAVDGCDFAAAMSRMSPASRRLAAPPAKPLPAVVRPLLGAALQDVLEALRRLFPHGEQAETRTAPALTAGIHDDGLTGGATPSTSSSRSLLSFARSAANQPTSHRPRLLLAGRPGAGQTSHLAPAVLHALERLPVHSLDAAALFALSSASPEEACAQVFCEARRSSPSILYLPHIQQWWDAAGSALRAAFLSLLTSIPPFCPVLLLATCSVPRLQLDPEVQSLFRDEYGEVYTAGAPARLERLEFFQDLILEQAAEAPPPRDTLTRPMELLPLAPPPPPRQLSQQERRRLEEQEEDVLRELRLFLRNVTERLSLDRRFRAFTRPVDIEEVPDYLAVIRRPMDFSSLLTNIDEQKYVTVGDFMADGDLIWQNALEYNPDRDPVDRHIRHRACALKDALRAVLREELDEDFERLCEEVKESRCRRAASCGAESVSEEAGGQRPRPPPGHRSGGVEAGAGSEASEQMFDGGRCDNASSEETSGEETSGEETPGEETPPLLIVDHGQLRELLISAVCRTDGADVEPLEKLYALLAQCIYRRRRDHDKTPLLQEMKKEVDGFSGAPAAGLF